MNHPASKNIIHLYNKYAHQWLALRQQCEFFEQAWLDRFLSLVTTQGTILDVGCGAGEPIARYFIQKGFSVHGIDASEPLIDHCERAFPEHIWQLCDMRAFHSETKYDAIIAWDSFFHLTQADQKQMIQLFGHYAKVGAPLMLTSGYENGEAIGCFQNEALFHASLSPAEYHSCFAQHGFEVVEYILNDEHCGRRCVWLAQKMPHVYPKS